jgi:hypothetical protein
MAVARTCFNPPNHNIQYSTRIFATVNELIRNHTSRHQYYAHKVGQLIYKQGDPVNAFIVLDETKDPLARKVLKEAAFEAAARGDIKRGRNRALEEARESGNHQDIIHAFLSLAQLNQQGFCPDFTDT